MVLGISFDAPEDNRTFGEQNGFPFRLLSDAGRTAGEAYGALRAPEEPNRDWAKRRTFLIDPDGVIVRAYRVSDILGHPAEVLEDLRALSAGRRPA